MTPTIRPAQPGDAEAIWALLAPVFRAGETYAVPRDIARDEALALWSGAPRRAFLAEAAGAPVGTYYLKANQAGGGDHVANCGYVTAAAARGRGVATAMLAHSLATARAAGFRAMQFNFVVETNRSAVRLWRRHGFRVVGRLPAAFRHPAAGPVDALVMHRPL